MDVWNRHYPGSDLNSQKNVREVTLRCDSLVSCGKFAKAAKCYDKVLELDPKNVDIWTKKGDSLLLLRNYH